MVCHLADFKPLAILGAGGFGSVFKVVHKKSKEVFAMKLLQKQKGRAGQSMLRQMQVERDVLSFVNHPYIVRLHYAFQTGSHLMLVMDLCDGGSMALLLSQFEKLQLPRVRLYAAEILLALSYLHEHQIVFRDLKPENIMLDQQAHCQLIDFGLAKVRMSSSMRTKTFCGTPEYFSPEMLNGNCYGVGADVYGLGVLTFHMLTGYVPFYSDSIEDLYKRILTAPIVFPYCIDPGAADFIQAAMCRQPALRLGAGCTAKAKQHQFFSEVNWDALWQRQVPVPCHLDVTVSSVTPSTLAEKWQRKLESMELAKEFRHMSRDESEWNNIQGWSFTAQVHDNALDMRGRWRKCFQHRVEQSLQYGL